MDQVILGMSSLGEKKNGGRSAPATDDIHSPDEAIPLRSNHHSLGKVKLWCSHNFTVNLLKRRLPIIQWLPRYSLEDLKGDLIAGLTVALTVIPQGLAYATLAGLPPQYGLYTAFMGCFMYTIFGSCKDLTVGPTAIMSLMTLEHAASGGIISVILITFLSGCIQLIMGLLNLGFLVTFISASVVTAFTSAAAITIAATQLAGVFGIFIKSQSFIDDVRNFFYGLFHGEVRCWDMAMGLTSVAFLLLLKNWNNLKTKLCPTFSCGQKFDVLVQTICTARNALLVLICSGVAAILLSNGIDVLKLTQEVKPGLPPFAFPEFSYSYFNNVTNQTVEKDFIGIVKDMGSGLVIIPLICILEAIAIAKSFGNFLIFCLTLLCISFGIKVLGHTCHLLDIAPDTDNAKGKKLDATQEMIAIGVCNIMGSFVSAYPATGSFSRTAINYSSGVRTPAGGIVTGSLVLLALGVMSPYFHFIPKASLSALIFTAVVNMVHYEDVMLMWKTNRMDLIPFFATFILSFVLGLEYGIIVGIAVSIGLLLAQESMLKIVIEEKKTFLGSIFLYVKPDRTILFPSAEKFQTEVLKAIQDLEGNLYAVIIDGLHLTAGDYTMAINLKAAIDCICKEKIEVIFINLKPNVKHAITGANPMSFVEFLSREEAEDYIETLSVSQTSPPAYNLDSQSLRSDDISLSGS